MFHQRALHFVLMVWKRILGDKRNLLVEYTFSRTFRKMKSRRKWAVILFVILSVKQENIETWEVPCSSNRIRCPVIEPIVNFDHQQFSGKWYSVMMVPLPDASPLPKCASQILSRLPRDELSILVRVSDQFDRVYHRTGRLTFGKSSSHLILLYPGDQFKHDYTIVSTDYHQYAIVYSCQRIDDSLTIGK